MSAPEPEMPEMRDPEIAALLDAERATPPPPEAAGDGLFSRIEATIASGAPVPAEAAPAVGSSAAGMGVKLLTAVAIVGAGTALWVALEPAPAPERETVATPETASAPSEQPEPALVEEAAAPPAAQPAVEAAKPAEPEPLAAGESEPSPVVEAAPAPEPQTEPEPAPATKQAPPARARTTAGHAPRPPTSSMPIEEPEAPVIPERVILDRARAALRVERPAVALEQLALHEKLHPDGILVEERESLYVRALVEAGDMPAARARAEAFERRFPGSLHLPAVRTHLERGEKGQ